MKRENHFVVIGNTPLAINTWRELAKRGRPVTRILRETPEEGENKDVDVVVGDPSMTETLREAGAHHAEAVLAMLADDSENAFAVLAVKELGGTAKTVAAVNDARHLGRVKLVQPDVVIAPQVLGGELAAMLLSGEQDAGVGGRARLSTGQPHRNQACFREAFIESCIWSSFNKKKDGVDCGGASKSEMAGVRTSSGRRHCRNAPEEC